MCILEKNSHQKVYLMTIKGHQFCRIMQRMYQMMAKAI